MSEEFRVVTRKKWIARRSLQRQQRRTSDGGYNIDGPEVDVDKFQQRFETLCERMTTTDYFTASMTTLEESVKALELVGGANSFRRLVCFGIGPFTRNYQALHQLAFILCTQRKYNIAEAIYFDPVFSKSEKKLLERLECKIMTENCEAKYEVDEPTLFYMPHCPNCLTNNLLWSNWQALNLQNVIVINNSFNSLANNTPKFILLIDAGHMLKVLPYVKEFPLDDDYEKHHVFNDLSVHVFPAQDLPEEDSDFWVKVSTPEYKDVEMIFAEEFNKLSLAERTCDK